MLTWFSKPSLESGKEGKQTNKHWESFICIVTFFLRKLYHKVKLAWPGTGWTKDNILYTRLNILIFLPILGWNYSCIILKRNRVYHVTLRGLTHIIACMNLQTTLKIITFSKSQPWFILKTFMEFRNFQPQYSYKIYSYKENKGVYIRICILVQIRSAV